MSFILRLTARITLCSALTSGTALLHAAPLIPSDIATPHPISRQLAQAEQLIQQRQAERALLMLDAILDEYPTDRRTLYTKARLLAGLNRLDEAQAIIDVLMQDDPVAALVEHLQGYILSRRGQWPEALAYYKRAYLAGHDVYFMNTMTQAYLNVEGPEATLDFLTAHLAQYPDEQNIRLARAKLYQSQQRYSAALADYEHLKNTMPANPAAWKNMADMFIQQRDKRALAHAREAARLAPNVPEVLHTLGRALLEFGEPAEALRSLRTAHNARPKDTDIAYDYALALAENSAGDEAMQIMRALGALDTAIGTKARRYLENVTR